MQWRVKRSLIGLSAAASLGLGLGLATRRWSRSEALTHGGNDLLIPEEEWHVTDYLHAATESTSHAKQSLVHCLRSARAAWERRQHAIAGGGGEGSSVTTRRPTSAVLLADFLTELHEGPEAQHPPTMGVAMFDRLSEWLLERATAPLADPSERRAIQRYLGAALRSEEAAEALLQRPGAAPKLLRLTAASLPLQQLLGAALQRAAPPTAVPEEDVTEVVSLLSSAAAQLRAARVGSSSTAAATAAGRQQQQQAALALQVMLAWAGASACNATLLAGAGAGPLLADLAALAATGTGVDGLQSLIVQLMGTLAQHADKPHLLRMQGWLYHLLCFAADALANHQWQLVGTSLTSLATCLLRGCELPVQLMQRTALPLLHKLAAHPGAPVRPAMALVVRALAEGPGVQLPAEEREFWSEMLVQWLVQLPGSSADDVTAAAGAEAAAEAAAGGGTGKGSTAAAAGQKLRPVGTGKEAGEAAELMRRVTAALEALATPAGSDGLHVVHAWLAEMIVHLSRQVQPYHAVTMPAAVPAGAAAAAAAAAIDSSAGGGSWWWPWGGSASAADVATAGVAGADVAVDASMAEAPSEVAKEGPYLPLPSTNAAAAAGSIDASGSSSWWKLWLWPWGGDEAGSGGEQAAAAKAATAARPSDSELSLYINASEIGPVYARSVAAELLEASGRVGAFQEPPAYAEELMGPEFGAVYPQVAAAIDMDLADSAVCAALKVLCALASGGNQRRSWLLDAGILPLLHRLTMQRARDVAELPLSAGQLVEGTIPLCIQRQGVRLLAMLSCDLKGAGQVQDGGWIPWLQDLAVSTDLKLSSCASRALLHIESAAATQRPGLAKLALSPHPLRSTPAPLLPTEQQAAAAAAAAAAADGSLADEGQGAGSLRGSGGSNSGSGSESPGLVAEAAEMLGEAREALVQARRRLDRRLDAVRPAVPPEARLVLQDGVHLFDPLAPHHEVLAREGISADTSDAPLLDIVFVHGIRGGAFATWRREGVLEHGQARESLDRSVCWPASWVSKEIPEARLLSIEYAAPVTGWEGEALPFQGTVAQMMEKLAAAGVGQRPFIFVSHSMGGLVVKDILVTAKLQKDERLRRLNTAAVGAVFYSVPHAGSRLADFGWYLRYLGVAPAQHVHHLKRGPHLDELNAAVRGMCKSGQLPVLSFSEGLPTKLAYIPTHVVPHESAYPGYGEFVVLAQHDHISVCKPSDPADPAYARLIAFLRARAQELRRQRADAAVAAMDHMEGALT